MELSLSLWEALWLLAVSSFTSSTILPGSSEVALVTFLYHFPAEIWIAFVVATMGNTLGSVLMLLIGRFFPEKMTKKLSPKMNRFIQRYGALSLLFSSLPIIGDILPVAAGWLRLNIYKCLIALLVGKAGRYLLIIYILNLTPII